MSKYTESECAFTKIPHLLEALTAIQHPCRQKGQSWSEKEIEVHLENNPKNEKLKDRIKKKYPDMKVALDGPVQLHGYHGDKRKQKANVVIPKHYVQGSANDIGFMVTKDGTNQCISEFDSGQFNEKWQDRLKDEYGFAEFKKKCRKEGWKYVEKRLDDGEPRLIIDNPT